MKTFLLSALLLCIAYESNSFAASKNLYPDSTHSFIENKGQIVDQAGIPRTDVRFVYNHDGFKLILRNTGFSYEWTKVVADNGENTESGQQQQSMDEEEDVVIPDVHFVSNRIDVDFSNCNPHAEVAGEGVSSFYSNYFNQYTGSAGVTNIYSYSRIIYKNIYNGIDLVFYTIKNEEGKVCPKYEFVVNPSGNMNNILLSYSGQQSMGLLPDGTLKLDDQLGYVNEDRPVILFADGSAQLQGQFVLNGSTTSFKNVTRKKNQTIIIDPTINWGTYYGGTGKDVPDEIGSDSQLNIYMTGSTRSASMIATTGAHQTVYSGGDDAALIKFDTNGNLVWATYYGGDGNDVPWAITIDKDDNVYIGGRTVSHYGIATAGAVIDTFSGGFFDVFIAKFNSAGVLLWGTYMGGPLKDEVQGMVTDKAGELYVSGYSESLTGISTPGTYKAVGDTAGESFLMKFTPDGHQIFGTYFGGKNRDRGHGVWVDGFGHVYQVGTTNSKLNIATPGSFQENYSGLLDAFLIQWTEEGHLKWATYYGGLGDERSRDVRTDDAGYIYFVGQTESESQIATPGSFKTTLQYMPGTNRDAFVVKFDSLGHRIWGTYYGGNKIDMPRALRVGRLGAPIYIGGYTKSDSGFATQDAYQYHFGGYNDAFFGKINWDASQLMYSTYYGGHLSESITAGGWYGSPLDVDAAGNIYLSSCTISSEGIATPGAYKTVYNDSDDYDYFLVKFADACSDPFEPNDSTDKAPTLPFNPDHHSITLHALIQHKKDKDYYIVNLQPGLQNMQVILSDLPFDCNLFVYDSSLNLVGKSQNIGTVNDTVSVPYGYVGKYYILVKSPYGLSYDPVNCYTLKVNCNYVLKQAGTTTSSDIAKENVLLYPNPSSDIAELVVTSMKAGACHIEISDLVGRILMAFDNSITTGENSIELPLKNLIDGNYVVTVHYNGQRDVLKLQVQK